MKILLVNDSGQTMAQVDDVEKYDGTLPGHTVELLDLLEVLIASAKSSSGGVRIPTVTWISSERNYTPENN
jgi:hypothetical protein